jgi:hypothetical protein
LIDQTGVNSSQYPIPNPRDETGLLIAIKQSIKMYTEKTLTRDEMRNVIAGSGTSCLICHTPGGTEEWERSAEGDPTEVCESIYPAYEDGEVSGSWGEC